MKQFLLVDGSAQFDFYDSNDSVILSSIEGLEYPVTRPVIEDLSSSDGSYYIDNKFGRRRISWEGVLKINNVFTKRNSLLAVTKVGNLKTLKFTTDEDLALQCNIDILDVAMPLKRNIHNYKIEAVVPDFRLYSQTLITLTTPITIIPGGVPIAAAIPAPIGGGSSLDFSFTNNGNISAWPVFTIRGPGTNFVVKNVITGELFNLNLTLLNNETVVVTTLPGARSVLKGTTNIIGLFNGDWIKFISGVNRLTFNVGSGNGANTQLQVSFRDTYLGI